MIAGRHSMMHAGASLPFDSAVAYLESTGTQYIDTGLTPGDNEMDYEIVVANKGDSTLRAGYGCRQTSSAYVPSTYVTFFNDRGNGGQARVDIANSGSSVYTAAIIGEIQTFIWDSATKTLRRFKDGNEGTPITAGSKSACHYSFVLFGVNTAGNKYAGASLAIYSAKFWKNGNLVRDYIPVRKGMTGELYDRMTGTFATRVGMFVFGPDVSYQQGG